jgi:hypothetical protein
MSYNVIIPLTILCIAVSIIYFYKSKKITDKGMFIWVGDDKYPNLMLVVGDTLGIFDINFTDYIGKPSYEMLNGKNTYNFENMSKDEFITKFGKVLEDFKKNPEDIYYKYKTFAIQQITFYEKSINKSMTKEEFIKKYENYYNELREYVKRKIGEGSHEGKEITAENTYYIERETGEGSLKGIEITAGNAYDALKLK